MDANLKRGIGDYANQSPASNSANLLNWRQNQRLPSIGSASKKEPNINMAPVRENPRLDARTIISYAKNFQDYDLGGHKPLVTGTRVPIGSMPSTLNQLDINKKIASFAKSRNSVNVKRSSI